MDISDLRDEFVLLAQEAVEGISITTVPGICWLEYFPILRHLPSWIPWMQSKRLTEHYRPIVERMLNKPFDEIKDGIVRHDFSSYHTERMLYNDSDIFQANGKASHSLASSIIERTHQRTGNLSNSIDDDIARNVAGVAFASTYNISTWINMNHLYSNLAAADTVSIYHVCCRTHLHSRCRRHRPANPS